MWKRKKVAKEDPLLDKLAGKIAGLITRVQTKFSNAMDKRFNAMSLQRMKLLLAGFCICSAGLSIYFFIDALVSKPRAVIRIDQVKMPRHFDRPGDEAREALMPDEVYTEIQQYRRYMDSLGVPIRSGLADSMRVLEEIYLQQQKQKHR